MSLRIVLMNCTISSKALYTSTWGQPSQTVVKVHQLQHVEDVHVLAVAQVEIEKLFWQFAID